ncbi:MAG: glycosyltransferase [Gammaproteobacteria bacterium]|jgi:dolichol-phosphate mannosyltransferase
MPETLQPAVPATPSEPRYSIVVPCYNEQDSIIALAEEILGVTRADPAFELIVVDDCSTDETRARLAAARPALAGPLRIVAHRVNSGQSAAICSGVDAARGEWIVTLDGDGQNDPADIPNLIRVLEAAPSADGRPIICGHRTTRRDTVVRRVSSRIANAVRATLLRDETPDTGCGLKLIHRQAFLRLPRFNHMHRFLPALVRRDGGSVISVPVGHRARQGGVSKYGIHNRLWVGIVDLVGVMWLVRRRFKSTNNEEI